MSGKIDARLADLEIALPEPPTPVANYTPFVISGGLIFVSGQVSRDGEELMTGALSGPGDVARGQAAARSCALQLIAQAKAATGGDLDRIVQVVKLVGFVNAAPGFTDAPQVINGASDLMVEVFGEVGRHARSAVGVSTLPSNVSVEVEAIFALAP